ncbi:hypothetical protein P7K49_031948 [Saguinus oedipus]|uniref:Uncharacterized protein n=1 Tax=Saguinus oedipus TaxID=9490 RepID=A0ABQ9U0W4_SAGOE|nr:hypothetical protein P7K49_031948 [Saguinus oedipus]
MRQTRFAKVHIQPVDTVWPNLLFSVSIHSEEEELWLNTLNINPTINSRHGRLMQGSKCPNISQSIVSKRAGIPPASPRQEQGEEQLPKDWRCFLQEKGEQQCNPSKRAGARNRKKSSSTARTSYSTELASTRTKHSWLFEQTLLVALELEATEPTGRLL